MQPAAAQHTGQQQQRQQSKVNKPPLLFEVDSGTAQPAAAAAS